ncbi:ATP-binding cassette domain-containing protein [Mesorhizobium sp. VK23B]|uniref:ATP-binding cassette domain-containing protein n=1 Tax=Mesorhizobium dulcispinae TaxID=3072316 RepID=A0ABU4X886_9HYPH|nr:MULTISPECIES: ATP-binding cassette domain-containing protein [unclassified Mesorhizobium]MDX8464626.1 ATP-binding cassette domain-containing protein [Mesorhizobium sp. VK23B]MDX8471012.1 ATP-binding cassette domain-containing protein [Mesorhizobium sp. VK23A]
MNDTATPADVALQVTSLRKDYGHIAAVNDVSFRLERGGSLAIVGESGSGKTTTAKMIMGLETPTAGTIVACGRDRSTPARGSAERRRRGRELQIVFQDPYSSLDPRQRIADMLAEVLLIHHRHMTAPARAARVEELLGLVGLTERHGRSLPSAMSGGQRQRAAIARAIAAEPEIVILDESVAALDVSIQAQVLNLLADLRAELGISYLFISHDLAVVRQITDTIVVMRNGSIVEQGRTEEVLDAPQHPYTRLLRASVPRRGWDLRALREAVGTGG